MNIRNTLRAGALFALGLGVTTGAWAQASAPARTPAAADRTFVKEAATGGMAEVELGKLAQQKGASDGVRQFGARMVDDHGKANEELKQIAGAKGLELPAAPTSEQQRTKAKLERMSGAAFDQAYLQQMVVDHRKTAAVMGREARAGRDTDLKAFAAKTLPTVEDHLKMAVSMQGGQLKAATATPR